MTHGHRLATSLLLCACLGLASLSAGATARPSTAPLSALSYQVYLPVVRKAVCTIHTCSMTLSATSTTPRVGDEIEVKVRLHNHGCGFLGLPLYRLTWDDGDGPPIFHQVPPLEILHYVAIYPREYDEATFVLQAAGSGRTELQARASIEVHLGYPGPAYWSACSAPRLAITVAPRGGHAAAVAGTARLPAMMDEHQIAQVIVRDKCV